jgi:hypothetical protein
MGVIGTLVEVVHIRVFYLTVHEMHFRRRKKFQQDCTHVSWITSIKLCLYLKVPKREIFDRSDFPHFYTIKSLRVGDFGVKIKKIKKNI